MDRTRRTNMGISRLTYTAPGQQTERTGTLGVSASTQRADDRGPSRGIQDPGTDTIEGIDYWIEFNQRLITLAEQDLQSAQTNGAEKDELDQNSMSSEDWRQLQANKTKINNAKRALKQASERLRDLYQKKDRLKMQLQQQEGASVPPSGKSTASVSRKSRSRESTSGRSSASTLKKRAELDAEDQILELRHKLDDEVSELERQIHSLRRELLNSQDKEAVEAQIVVLEDEKMFLERDFARKEKQMRERLAQAQKKILLELEEDELLNSDQEETSPLVQNKSTEAHQKDGAFWQNDLIPNDWSGFGFPQPAQPLPKHQPEEENDHLQPPDNFKQLPAATDTGDAVLMLANTLTSALRGVRTEKDWEPKDLPIFNGNAEDWPIFYNEFDRTTPLGKTSTSQNLIRLRKALKGSAKDAVVGLLHEPQNVGKIIRILQERFGRPELIIRALIEKADHCKSPDVNKPETFVTFGTAVQHLVETVRSMKEERYLNDMTLLDKLVSKMPATHAREWLLWKQKRPYTTKNLSSFGEWIDESISLNVQLTTPAIKDDNSSPKSRGTRGPVKVHALTHEQPPQDDAKDSCSFCQMKNHVIGKCFKFRDKPIEEKIKHVKDNGLCFRCLESGHAKRNCTSSVICGKNGCKILHHPLIHTDEKAWNGKKNKRSHGAPNEDATQESDPAESRKETLSNLGAVTVQQSKPISIVQIRVKGPRGIRKVYALLDSGCDTTIILSDLAAELGIGGRQVRNQCHVVGGKSFSVVCKEVGFEVAGTYKTAKFYTIKEALTMETVGLTTYTQNADEVKQRWTHLKRAKLDNFHGVKVQVIIGEDHPYVTAHRELLQREPHEPMAKRTLLGWVLAGKVNSRKGSININALSVEHDDYMDNLIKSSFSLESYGLYPKDVKGSLEDRRALEILRSTVKKVGEKQWECGLLWKDPSVKLPDSREDAIARLFRNEKRMRDDSIYLDMYHAKIEEYIQKGYARELTPQKKRSRSDKTFYIPHFGVYNVNKPGKIRLVFDATCRGGGASLNEHLLTGPDLIKPLPTVLMNFRIHNYAITGDMEDMYHRVAVRSKDQDSQRFLWRNMNDRKGEIRDYVMKVLVFGSCCSQSSAIYVKDKNAEQYADKYPEAVRAIQEDFYSDDCLSGAQTIEDAVDLRKRISDINAEGNFAVKKWLSNSKEVIATIPEEDRATGVKAFSDKSEIPAERVLGLWWKPEEDVFTFSANFKKIDPSLLEGRRPTKRQMCSVLMSLFDPLGFIANFRIKGLILLQQTWQTGVNWDDEIPDSIYQEWKVWVGNLKETEKVRVPRVYISDIHLATNIQLHTLVDASEEATSAICYLRVKIGNCVSLAFVSAKTKVAPLKKQTIPRLELIAAVMGACLADTIVNELRIKIHEKCFWSDSRTVLKWIRTESLRYKEYVANRVNRIHLLSSVREWRWIPTELNVADQGTRLHKKIDLSPASEWLNGPAFLLQERESWPTEEASPVAVDEEKELRKTTLFAAQVLGDPFRIGAISRTCGLKGGERGVTVDMERFSSYNRMVRAQSGVIEAANFWLSKCRGKVLDKPWNPKKGDKAYPLETLQQAELMLIRKAQSDAFGEDITALLKSGQLPKGSKLWSLSPFIEDGLLRINGRIGKADVAQDVKTPILLSARHPFTTLLIMREHQQNAHQGQETVLCELRKKFWILEGRATVRRVVEKCQFCKLRKAIPVVQRMGELPHYRVAIGDPPFTYTGVDLMGPVEVTVGRHHEKRWVIVFTCMVTRAIHLDVVHGLSTDETMMALSRFIDQRGRPRNIYSDNGTNFVSAMGELKRNWNALNWTSIMNTEKFREIKWQFSPACTPHFGGAWERMVREVKKILKNTLFEKYPRDQTLQTMLKGAENIINSRPMTRVSSDPTDPAPLTANHLLRGFADVGPTIPGEYEEADEQRKAHWRRAQHFVSEFWKRWSKEVLPELMRREKWRANTEPLAVGDIVLLVDDQAPRNTWRKGVVAETFPGNDGQVRVVRVETAEFGKKKRTSYRRGTEKVIPLGLRVENQSKYPDFGGRNVESSRRIENVRE